MNESETQSESEQPQLTKNQMEHAEHQKALGRAFAVAVDRLTKGMVLIDELHPMAAYIVLYEASQRLRMSIEMSDIATEGEIDVVSINVNRHLEKHQGELKGFVRTLKGKAEQ